MNYTEAINYINSFINFEKIPQYNYAGAFKLERMQAVLQELGNPQQDLKVLHIAGSKGKGSVCAITAYILREANFKVGLYTSPHLVDFRERIRILTPSTKHQAPSIFPFEGMITEDEFIDLIERIKPTIEKFRHHKTLGKASFFEVLTICAFLYFKEKQVDFVVLETGLGGRLDATNVVVPLVCGITNISLEHTDKLGNSLSEIAFEKAGIIKKGIGVVIAGQIKEARDVIKKVCEEKNAPLYEVGREIDYSIVSSDENGQVFDLKGPGYSYENLELNLIGRHQVENAAVSIGMLNLGHLIEGQDAPSPYPLPFGERIREGLRNVTWPGRLQIIQKKPYIILDGAQNTASMSALIYSIKALFRYKRLITIFGISKDKDIKGVSTLLGTFSDIIILTKAKDNIRATEPVYLREGFEHAVPCLEISDDIDIALQKALKLADEDDLILVTGSLFVVGDALRGLQCATS